MSEQVNVKELRKKEIRSVLLAKKGGLSLSELEELYKHLIGHDIPFRQMGYSTLKDFICDIPDVVSWRLVYGNLILTGVPDASTQHIAMMVARQKNSKQKNSKPKKGHTNTRLKSSRFVQAAPRHSRPPAAETSWKSTSDVNKSEGYGIFYNHFRGQVKDLLFAYPTGLPFKFFDDEFEKKFRNRPPVQKLGFNNSMDLIKSMPDIATLEGIESSNEIMVYAKLGRRQQASNLPSANQVTENGCVEDNFPDNDEQSDAFEEIALTTQQKAQIQQVLALHPNGLKASRFSSAFKQMFRCDPDLKNFLTVVDLMASIPDTVSMERPTSGDWLLFDARTYKQSSSTCTDPSRSLKQDMMLVIPTIIDKFPHGLLLRDLPAQFQAHTGQQLDYAQLGFSSLDDVIYQLKDYIAVLYKGEGELLLTVKHSSYESPSSMTVAQRDLLVPQDAVIMGQRFCVIPPPPVSSDYVTVCVSNVDSPGKFWLQLCSYSQDLSSLMDELQEYHNRALDCYKVPSAMLQTGLVCAGLYTDSRTDWHRCIVTGFQDQFVELFYVDYGTTAFASRLAIRLLRSKYLLLPAQAVGARLTNTYPVGGGWSKEAFDCFMKMVVGHNLLARVTHVGHDDNDFKLSVCLCDTSGEDDIHIQDVLVQSGYAKYQQDNYGVIFPAETTAVDRPDSSSSRNNVGLAAGSSKHQNNFNNVSANGALHGSLIYDSTKLVKYVHLTAEHSIHLIEINHNFYVNSSEVSALLWDDDIVKTELRRHGNVKIKKLMLTKEDDKELVVELARASVGGVVNNGLLRPVVTLYELPSVLDILNLFDHASSELKSAVERLIMEFYHSVSPASSANHSVKNEDTEVCNESSMNKKEQELSKLLSYLTSQRRVILAKMQRPQTAEQSRQTVDLLTEIESQQESVHQQLNDLRARQSLDGVVQHSAKKEGNFTQPHYTRETIPVANVTRAVVSNTNETLRYPLNPANSFNCDLGPFTSPSTPSLSALFSQMKMTQDVAAAGSNYPGLEPSVSRMSQFGLGGLSPSIGLGKNNMSTTGFDIGAIPNWNQYLQYVAQTDVNALMASAGVTFGGKSVLGTDTLRLLAARGGLSGQ